MAVGRMVGVDARLGAARTVGSPRTEAANVGAGIAGKHDEPVDAQAVATDRIGAVFHR